GGGAGDAGGVVEAAAAGYGAVVGEHTVGNRSAAAELHVVGAALGPPPPEAAVPAVRLVAGEQGVADHEARRLRDQDAAAVRRSAPDGADGPVVADGAPGDRGGCGEYRHAPTGA